jgi:hypothetical protein
VWVKYDVTIRLNDMGTAVCEYFDRVFDAYPLNREGSVAASRVLKQYKAKAQTSLSEETMRRARDIADTAEMASFLMVRPRTHGEKVSDDALPEIVESDTDTASLQTPVFACEADLSDFLRQIMTSAPASLYHRLLADDGLTPAKWRAFVEGVIAASTRLQKLSPFAVVCVFVDELNTAGCLGLVSEAFTSHSLDGLPLPGNIFFVGAVNPLRDSSSAPAGVMDFTRSNISQLEENESSDYLAGVPYIVRPLSPGMECLKLWYPNLESRAEILFLREYLQFHLCITKPVGVQDSVWEADICHYINVAVEMIASAQEIVRGYNVPRVFMSIRNLIRCTQLLSWLMSFTVPTERGIDGIAFNFQNIFLSSTNPLSAKEKGKGSMAINLQDTKNKMRKALIMAISVTYMFQLPSNGHVLAGKAKEDLRLRFVRDIIRSWGTPRTVTPDIAHEEEWKSVIENSLSNFFSFANVPRGLAHTTALKENFYCVVLAAMNKMPLLISGPPGCGKTLSFLLACETLKGNCPTHSVAFQHLKKAKKVMYQCSIASTGPEVAAVYSDTHMKQEHLEAQQPGRHICLLGMDEAGLTPENRQALKSLHDFLDTREIGTVMMSNTTLDVAKTNRTIQLLQTQVGQKFIIRKIQLTFNTI